MTETREPVSTVVLQNKGVPILLAVLNDEGQVQIDARTDAPVTEEVHVRFTANEVAEIEEWYDDAKTTVIDSETKVAMEIADVAAAFDADLQGKPMRTVRRVLALALGEDLKVVGKRMLADQTHIYVQMIGAAWSIAMGVDPEKVGKGLATQIEIAQRLHDARESLYVAVGEAQTVSRGTDGSEPGPASEDPLTSSGVSVPAS